MSGNQSSNNPGLPGPIPDFSGVAFIYFDLDDTLIDHKTAQERAMVDIWTFYPELQAVVEPGQLTSVYAGVNNRLWTAYRNGEIDQSTLKRHRIEDTFRELQVEMPDWREIDGVYMECYQRHWEWIADARTAFLALTKSYPVGVMTNGFTDTQQKKFEYFSLHRYSKHLIISEQAGYLKPDPRIFEFSAKKAGYEPGQLLYVGDSYPSDIVGGSASGWRTAWYHQNGPVPDDNLADFTFRHFSQLVEVLTPNH